ncbi:MAG: hypothetical protein JO362_14530, partial [Streptomycetaceae bacterium]|nr:hypothetical protein [Streptomycetaceae bacterium]
ELLVCPFHRFAFDPEGACAKVPVGKPPRARLDHYPIREQHGIIYLWYGDGEPKWELPEIDDTGFGPPVFCSKDMSTHPQEILENVIDYAHLRELHGMDVLKISPLEAEGPYLRMNLRVRAATLPVLGDIVANQPSQMAGLGWNLAELTLPDSGVAVRTWGLPTPTGPWQTRLNMATACAPALSTRLPSQLRAPLAALTSRVIATTLLRLTLKIFDEDQSIWNHKKYEPHPRLGPEDKGIGPYRRWARQFYPLPPEMPEVPVNGSRPTPAHGPAFEEAEAQR